MKTEKIIWGLIFIFVGTVVMLDNFDVINFYWRSIWRFWPVIFILIGANMLLGRFADKTTGTVVTALITVGVLAFIGYQGSRPRAESRWMNFEYDNHERNKDADWNAETTFSEPFSGTKIAVLNIQGGATVYSLSDSTSDLFQAEVKEPYGGYTLNKTTIDSAEVLNFRKRDNRRGGHFDMDDMEANETRLSINTRPVWNLNVEMGAGETTFNLENFKVRRLEFKGGAASFHAKIGSKLPVTDVAVETGVANVEIEIPELSGCRIKVDSGMSSKDFEGFIKQADGSYETANFASAANKINISLKGGLSAFEVRKY